MYVNYSFLKVINKVIKKYKKGKMFVVIIVIFLKMF